jgi:hypothetical protein
LLPADCCCLALLVVFVIVPKILSTWPLRFVSVTSPNSFSR